jgi:hypothetical protein
MKGIARTMGTQDRSRRSDLRQALDQHLGGSPGTPLRTVIRSPDIESRLVRFDAADQVAIKEQGSYRSFGRFALWATMIGTVVGALLLLPIDLAEWPRRIVEALHALAMILTFIAVFWISLRKSVSQWMQARAEAERARADVFRAILRSGAGANELLAPALACFKDAHLDWQLNFFKRRGAQHRQSAGNAAPYRVVGYALLTAALFLGFVGIAHLATELGWWPELKSTLQSLPLHEPGRWQLGLGAIASSILAFASARSFMDQDDRNASCYALAAVELERIKRNDLAKAEAAAAAGNVADVLAFAERVQTILDAEHLAWAFSRPTGMVIGDPHPKV